MPDSFACADDYTVVEGWDIAGTRLAKLKISDPRQCCFACASRPECVAFSSSPSNFLVGYVTTSCYLFSAATAFVPSSSFESGVKAAAFPGLNLP